LWLTFSTLLGILSLLPDTTFSSSPHLLVLNSHNQELVSPDENIATMPALWILAAGLVRLAFLLNFWVASSDFSPSYSADANDATQSGGIGHSQNHKNH